LFFLNQKILFNFFADSFFFFLLCEVVFITACKRDYHNLTTTIMKKIVSKFLFLLALGFTLLQSCSKSDAPAVDNPLGGDAFRMQIVTIDLPNTTLANTEYHGTISNVSVTLRKSDEHKLVVMIPGTVALGNQDLVINDLNNLKVTYNVKDVVLTTTPDATIADMQTNLSTFQQTVANTNPQASSAQQAISNFNAIYSNATAENKIKMASLYKANKTLFDDIILNDFSSISGRSLHDALILIYKHKAAVIAMAAGLALTRYGAEGIEKATGIVLLSVGFYKAIGFGKQFTTETCNTVQIEVANTVGINNKNANTTNNTFVSLTNNVATTVPFNTIDRTVITSDSNKTESGMSQFFTYFDMLNGYVNLVNPVIQWVNSNVPFANFSLLTNETVPDTCSTVTNPMDAASFQKLTFSITDPALTLQNATLTSSGQLSLNVKIVGTSTTPIQSSLKYSYADDYSTFSGSIPITVSLDDIPTVTIGTQTWTLKNLDVATYRNGDPIPQVQDPTAWAALTTGAWCYYNNDSSNGAVYGKLYNWYAVNDPRGLAPTGYHVPTDAEWTTLINFLGGESVAGNKMKASTGWTPYNGITNTNSSGFTALPGGACDTHGTFSNIGENGLFWSSSESDTLNGRGYFLYSAGPLVGNNHIPKKFGQVVRCVKD
jgi:uncharacterized protein (TIGR02145 family)